MKISTEKIVEIALTAGIAGLVSFGGGLGFSTPKAKIDEHETRIKAIEDLAPKQKFEQHDKDISELKDIARTSASTLARLDQKTDDMTAAMGLRHRGHP